MLSLFGFPVLNHLRARLRPRLHALLSAQAVVLDAGANAKAPLAVHPLAPQSPAGPVSLDPAVGHLLRLLDQPAAQGRSLQLVVSDHWLHPALLTLPDPSCSDQIIQKMLVDHYRQVYGDLADAWCWTWQRHASRLLALAWPQAAMQALQSGLAQRQCVLTSALPLSLALTQGVPLPVGASWLIVASAESATLLRQDQGVLQDWCVLQGTQLAQNVSTELARSAARRGDACKAVQILTLNAANDATALCQALLQAGWQASLLADNGRTQHWATRLHQAASAHPSA